MSTAPAPCPETIEAALRTLIRKARRHPEFDDCNPHAEHQGSTTTPVRLHLVNVRFNKNGSRIFVNPHRFDSDYDWPELVGADVLKTLIEEAAREHGLSLSDTLKPAVHPSEKGWVQLGFAQYPEQGDPSP